MATDASVDPKVAAIVADLEAPAPLNGKNIAKKHGVHASTVSRIRERYAVQIKATEKANTPTKAEAKLKGFRAKAVKVIDASLDLLTNEKLKKCSAPQLAVIAGILRDKVRDMDKQPDPQAGDIVLRFGDRKAMISFLRGREPEREALPTIDAEIVKPAAVSEPPI